MLNLTEFSVHCGIIGYSIWKLLRNHKKNLGHGNRTSVKKNHTLYKSGLSGWKTSKFDVKDAIKNNRINLRSHRIMISIKREASIFHHWYAVCLYLIAFSAQISCFYLIQSANCSLYSLHKVEIKGLRDRYFFAFFFSLVCIMANWESRIHVVERLKRSRRWKDSGQWTSMNAKIKRVPVRMQKYLKKKHDKRIHFS